jgi:hypothetical protein
VKGRLPFLGLLVGSMTLLVSLYLPWANVAAAASQCPHRSGALCILNLYSGANRGYDGWLYAFGGAVGLLAAGVMVAAATQLAGRPVLSRLPLPTSSLALVFFTAMNAAYLWNQAKLTATYGHLTAHLAYGAYVGLVGASLCVVSVLGLPWREIESVSASAVAGAALALGLLAAFLIQQLTVHITPIPARAYLALGGEVPELAVCALALFGLPLLLRGGPASVLRAGSAAIAVLTGAYLFPFRAYYADWSWELWLVLACAIALVVLTLATGGPLRLTRPTIDIGAFVAAGGLLLVSLFLPWQTGVCSPRLPICVSSPTTEGWTIGHGAIAGTLAVLLLIGIVGYGRTLREFALGAVIYVLATGLTVAGYTVGFAYGAVIGFIAAALLLFFAVRRLRPIPQARFLIRLVPLAACLGFLAFAVGSIAGDSTFEIQSPWRLSVLTAAAIVLTLRLLLSWSEQPRESDAVVLLPLGLLLLTTLDLIWIRDAGISWEGWVAVFLCLVLAACGWVERNRGGLERLRIPEEIWRVDRLPTAED